MADIPIDIIIILLKRGSCQLFDRKTYIFPGSFSAMMPMNEGRKESLRIAGTDPVTRRDMVYFNAGNFNRRRRRIR